MPVLLALHTVLNVHLLPSVLNSSTLSVTFLSLSTPHTRPSVHATLHACHALQLIPVSVNHATLVSIYKLPQVAQVQCLPVYVYLALSAVIVRVVHLLLLLLVFPAGQVQSSTLMALVQCVLLLAVVVPILTLISVLVVLQVTPLLQAAEPALKSHQTQVTAIKYVPIVKLVEVLQLVFFVLTDMF